MSTRQVVWGAVVALVLGTGGTAAWLSRAHAITYRAEAGSCRAMATFSEPGGERVREPFTGRFEREVTLTHGETANLVVSSEAGCPRPARCSIEEDGDEVAQAGGRYGAICSVGTAR